MTGCTAAQYIGNGVSVLGSGGLITNNNCSSNGTSSPLASGIYTTGSGNRIEGNTVASNDFGIFVDGTVPGNMVVGNHARANTTNYSNPASGNFIGTLVGTNAAMNAATNSLVNISF